MPNTNGSLHSGSRVYDKCAEHDPEVEKKELVVVGTHDKRADEYIVKEQGKPLAELVENWPVGMPDSYDPDADTVVEVAYHESLDWAFGGAWVECEADRLRKMCELNDVQVYAFHRQRLAPL